MLIPAMKLPATIGVPTGSVLLGLSCLLASVVIAPAQDTSVEGVLTRFDELRPDDRQLAMYRLDWAASLDEAQVRAKREGRPIFLVIIHAKYGDILSGHC